MRDASSGAGPAGQFGPEQVAPVVPARRPAHPEEGRHRRRDVDGPGECRGGRTPGHGRVAAADEERDRTGRGMAVVARDRVAGRVGLREPPAGLAVHDDLARLRAEPQPLRATVVGDQHAGLSLGHLPHPAHGAVAVTSRPGPVEEVGAAVLGHRDLAGQERVVVQRARSRLITLVGRRPVHRVVGQHDHDRVLPAAARPAAGPRAADLGSVSARPCRRGGRRPVTPASPSRCRRLRTPGAVDPRPSQPTSTVTLGCCPLTGTIGSGSQRWVARSPKTP